MSTQIGIKLFLKLTWSVKRYLTRVCANVITKSVKRSENREDIGYSKVCLGYMEILQISIHIYANKHTR